ncbi:hypothetical protein FA15DRAFT_669132 [Coprinopsis marcescibilis]|uniref:HTH APSES-type domain-containing protein n=1 Tax=Coprinopsis marcescibilis TaxID=230819 RepID=A0A5C3KWM7_COPMA|nr:hypothetical protein FA15DRAFT_669132 [Coprinopsis marcescibilis]
MATGMLQETLQTTSASSSGSRFRPYASPDHQVTKGRYITSNDPRGYIPVYEYPLNGQWIMMDIDDGYILWTGIWKALGNSKADIVKMIDSQPDLAPLIRRVRGGYLKIQGTWMPYEVALKLSRRVAWPIRHDLVPLFGPTFPSTCLSPDQPGFGQVVATSQTRRRVRRNTQANTQIPRDTASNWTVMTPGPMVNLSFPHSQFSRPPLPSIAPSHAGPQSDYAPSPQYSHRQVESPDMRRYALYGSHASPTDRKASISNKALSLEIPPVPRPSSSKPKEPISLPPIQQANSPDGDNSPYALPPISALEDLRGVDTQDSAAVLRRLRLDDDYPPSGRSSSASQDSIWGRRYSLSAHPHSRASDSSSRFQPYLSSRSYQDSVLKRSRSPTESFNSERRRASDFSQEDSASTHSPISPATPNSSLLSHSSFSDLKKLANSTDNRYNFPRISGRDWAPFKGDHLRSSYRGGPSPLEMDSDSESSLPHRPW